MNEKPWWATVLQWTIVFLVTSFVLGWLAQSRARSRPIAFVPRLAYPPSTLVIGAVCFLFFASLAVISNVFANETTTWWTTSIFVGFALLSVALIVQYFTADYLLSEDGLSYRTLFGKRKFMRWSELQRVRYAAIMNCFRLEARSGEVARVSTMLMGLPEFARLLLEYSPGIAIDPAALPILKETAEGNYPSL